MKQFPWTVVSVITAICAVVLVLFCIPDETGTIQTALLVICPLIGIWVGMWLDARAAKWKRPPE